MKHLFLSLSGLVAALRSENQTVVSVLDSSMFCFDRPGLIEVIPGPDGGRTAYYNFGNLEFSNDRERNFVLWKLDDAYEEGRLHFPSQDRLDYQQLDGFLAQQGLHPTGLAGNLGYNYPDTIAAILRANPRDLLVYDHAGRPWSSITADWPHSDDPLDGDPESLATA